MMKKVVLTLIYIALSSAVFATAETQQLAVSKPDAEVPSSPALLKQLADSAYQAADYQQAIVLYDSLLASEGRSMEVFYNLAGAYFKDGDIAHAILYYERALLLSPGDEDVRFNLEFVRSQTIDRIVPHHEIFFVTWWRSLVALENADTWGIIAASMFGLMLICVLLFLFASQMWIQKTNFSMALLLLAGCIICNICAWQQANHEESHRGAVVMTSSAVVRSTPAESGTELFVLHEGTRLDITDDTMQGWKEIVLADGKKGWIETARIEKI